MGHQNKFIAYLLGLSASAVASHLASAERKLGLKSRAELVARLGFLAERAASQPTLGSSCGR
jgi:DNA-binding CsgD family transcriptional regulator